MGSITTPEADRAATRSSRPQVLYSRADALALTVFFVLVHGFSFLTRVVAWDGWCYYELLKRKDFTLVAWNHVLGAVPQGVIVYWLIACFPDPILGGKIVDLGFLLISSLAFLHLLELYGVGDRDLRLLAAAIFAIHGNSLVNIGLGMANYNWGTATFGAAMVLHAHSYLSVRAKWLAVALRSASVVLFLASFLLPSLLVFYLVFLVAAYFLQIGSFVVSGRALGMFAREHACFLALPIISWALRLKPSGQYAGQNAFTSPKLWLLGLPAAIWENVLPALALPVKFVRAEPLLLAVVLILIPVIWSGLAALRVGQDRRLVDRKSILVLASLTYICGVFPFLAVGKVPGLADAGSRLAMLISVPVALVLALIVGAATTRMNAVRRRAVYAIVLALLATAVIENYRRWDVDGMKQAAVVQQLRELPEIRGAQTVYVYDSTDRYNNLSRQQRFYEYNAWFLEAFGDERRLGVPVAVGRAYVTDEMAKRIFLMVDYPPRAQREAALIIRYGRVDPLTLPAYVSIKLSQVLDSSAYERKLREIVTLSAVALR